MMALKVDLEAQTDQSALSMDQLLLALRKQNQSEGSGDQ